MDSKDTPAAPQTPRDLHAEAAAFFAEHRKLEMLITLFRAQQKRETMSDGLATSGVINQLKEDVRRLREKPVLDLFSQLETIKGFFYGRPQVSRYPAQGSVIHYELRSDIDHEVCITSDTYNWNSQEKNLRQLLRCIRDRACTSAPHFAADIAAVIDPVIAAYTRPFDHDGWPVERLLGIGPALNLQDLRIPQVDFANDAQVSDDLTAQLAQDQVRVLKMTLTAGDALHDYVQQSLRKPQLRDWWQRAMGRSEDTQLQRLVADYTQTVSQLSPGPVHAAAQQFLRSAQAAFWLGRTAHAWQRAQKCTGNKAILARIDTREKLRTACDAAGLSFAGFSTESLDEHGVPAEVIDAVSARLHLAWRSTDQDDSLDFYAIGQTGLRVGLENLHDEAQRLVTALAERRKPRIYNPAVDATITRELEANPATRPTARQATRQPGKN